MRLCDRDIETWLNEGRLSIIPRPSTKHINGATVDIHLGNKLCTFSRYVLPFIDLSKSKDSLHAMLNKMIKNEINLENGETFYLHPNELVLAITFECVTIPADLVGWLDGRSSLARFGLMIHITAHRIDPGWSGHIVLELFNVGKLPLVLHPGMHIGALSFELLTGLAVRPYNCQHDVKPHNQDKK